jgi:hypothetical protein
MCYIHDAKRFNKYFNLTLTKQPDESRNAAASTSLIRSTSGALTDVVYSQITVN